VDVENKESARQILPPAYRSEAKIVGLIRFDKEVIEGGFGSSHV
jgi:hypothetical protein